MIDKTDFCNTGYEQITKTVKQSGNTGRVYLPVFWVGCEVAIIRLSEKRVDDEKV